MDLSVCRAGPCWKTVPSCSVVSFFLMNAAIARADAARAVGRRQVLLHMLQ